jgi:hypothetical protein
MDSKEPLLADRLQRIWREWSPARAELEQLVCDIVSPPSRPCWIDLEFDPFTKTLVLEFTNKRLGVQKRMRERLYRLGIEWVVVMESDGKRSWRRPE